MSFDREINHRRSIRLRGYDYSADGAYFVTICVQGRECLFGGIVDNEMVMNDAGRMVAGWWAKLPDKFSGVTLDEYVVMPNHFHGIVWLTVGAGFPRPGSHDGSLGGETPPIRWPTLGQVLGFFKYQTTKDFNMVRGNPGFPLWQRNYYERIIRDEAELHGIREYIRYNPTQWESDEEFRP